MKSAKRGSGTLEVEVTNLSPSGFWILLDEKEMFIPFDDFPWFEDATIRAIGKVQRLGPDHLYWPDLDIDLSVESIEHPERFPLKSKLKPQGSRPAARKKQTRKATKRPGRKR